jgi:hypothetical protein
MKRTAMIITAVAALGATGLTAPAEARGRGYHHGGYGGAGIGFGLAAGALAAGAYGAYGPGMAMGTALDIMARRATFMVVDIIVAARATTIADMATIKTEMPG